MKDIWRTCHLYSKETGFTSLKKNLVKINLIQWIKPDCSVLLAFLGCFHSTKRFNPVVLRVCKIYKYYLFEVTEQNLVPQHLTLASTIQNSGWFLDLHITWNRINNFRLRLQGKCAGLQENLSFHVTSATNWVCQSMILLFCMGL